MDETVDILNNLKTTVYDSSYMREVPPICDRCNYYMQKDAIIDGGIASCTVYKCPICGKDKITPGYRITVSEYKEIIRE